MKIIGRPTLTYPQLEMGVSRMPGVHPRFRADMLPHLWEAALAYLLDPLGVAAQAFKETGGGNYQGNVPAWFYNTCGLKIREKDRMKALLGITYDDHAALHNQFTGWPHGARGHVQHLLAYTGHALPAGHVQLSPRAHIVYALGYRLNDWEEFGGGRWAPAGDYGEQVVATAQRIVSAAA